MTRHFLPIARVKWARKINSLCDDLGAVSNGFASCLPRSDRGLEEGSSLCLCALRLRGSDLARFSRPPFPSFIRFDGFAVLVKFLTKVPNYAKIFLLRLVSNSLPTSRRLRHQQLISRAGVAKCFFCGQGEDSADHLFARCDIVRLAFLIFFRHCAVPAVFARFDLASFCLLGCPVSTPRDRKLWVAFYLSFGYAIWFFRPRVLAYRASVDELQLVHHLVGLTSPIFRKFCSVMEVVRPEPRTLNLIQSTPGIGVGDRPVIDLFVDDFEMLS